MNPSRLLLTIAAAALFGCNSTGVGNPGATVTLAMVSDDHVEPGADPSDTELLPASQVNHAVLAFAELRWIPCNDGDEAVVVPGPVLVDLATNRVEPELPEIPLPPSGLCGIDAVLGPATEPAAMAGRTVLFSGLREDGVLFILYADMRGTLRMRPRPGVVWDLESTPSVLWTLRPRRWLEESELNEADPESTSDIERIVPIDVDRHPVLYEAIRSRLAGRSSLQVDFNNNQQLDPDELADEAWIGTGLPSLD